MMICIFLLIVAWMGRLVQVLPRAVRDQEWTEAKERLWPAILNRQIRPEEWNELNPCLPTRLSTAARGGRPVQVCIPAV